MDKKGFNFNNLITVIFIITLVFYVGYNYMGSPSSSSSGDKLSTALTPARDLTGVWEGSTKWQNNVGNPACSYEGTIRFNLKQSGNQLTGTWQTTITKANQLLKSVPCSGVGENPLAELSGTVSGALSDFSSSVIDFSASFTGQLFKGTFESCPDQACSDGSHAVGAVGDFTTMRKS